MQAKTDDQIIASRPPRVRERVRVELTIVNAIIDRATTLGYTLRVFAEGDEYGEPGSYDVKTALFDLDVAEVEVEDAAGDRVGAIALVFGNGCDLVSDYGPVGTQDGELMTRMEDFIIPICELAEMVA